MLRLYKEPILDQNASPNPVSIRFGRSIAFVAVTFVTAFDIFNPDGTPSAIAGLITSTTLPLVRSRLASMAPSSAVRAKAAGSVRPARTYRLEKTMRQMYVLFCVFSIGMVAFAQQDRTALSGQVTDSAGRYVIGATVSVTDVATGTRRITVTNESGSYAITGLLVGVYRAGCNSPGFRTIEVQPFRLEVGQERVIQFTLMPAAADTSIEVVSTQPILNLTSSAVGAVIAGTQVQNLPLNGRDFNNLSALAPGAINSGVGDQGSIRFAGHGADDNNFRVDGVDATGILNQDQRGSMRLQISTEAIAEFSASSAVYTAESGATNGGQIEIVSKSGTNKLHGSVFEFLRNDVFDALPFATTTSVPLRLNQFGGGIGGPILKNRTFFFANFEGLRQIIGQPLTGFVPSPSYRAAVLATSPALKPFLDAFPEGSMATSDPNVLRWFGSGRQTQSENSGLIRVDHQLSPKLNSFARYMIDNSTADQPVGGNVGILQQTYSNNVRAQNFALGLQQVYSSSFLNDTRFGFNRIYNPIVVDNPLPAVVYVPEFTELLYSNAERFADNTFSVLDNATRQFGRHTFKAGVEIKRVQMNNTTSLQEEDQLIYLSEQAFQNNQVAQATLNAPLPVTGMRKTIDSAYVQDEFKLKQNLTITAGLRYDFFSNFHEIHNDALVFDPYSCGAQGYCPTGAAFYFPRTDDLGPRLSVVWAPAIYQGKTVINAGVGRYYGEGQLGDLNAPTANIATRITLNEITSPGLSYPVVPYVSQSTSSVITPRALERNRKDAAVDEWNLYVQQNVGAGTIFQLGYLGSKGDHLLTRTYINEINPATGQRPFPLFGLSDEIASYTFSNFHALQAGLRRSFTRGLLFTVNYQWSKSMDDGTVGGGEADYAENASCQRCEYSVSDQDVAQVFTASIVYELPFGKGRTYFSDVKGVVGTLASGWQFSGIISARSGLPVDVEIARAVSDVPDGNIHSPQRPNRIPGASLYYPHRTPAAWINPAAFTTPASGTWGNLGRNAVRGPGAWQVDPALTKDTKLTERVTFQFRAEAFNVLNRVQLGNPSGNLSGSGFGQILTGWNLTPVGTGTPRLLQFMGRLNF